MGRHLTPGFIFSSNSPNDSNVLSLENLNQMVTEASINSNFYEHQPSKKEIKPFDKFLVLDSFSRSFQNIEARNLFNNTKLTGESCASLAPLTDCSDRIVTTKFLNLLFGNLSEDSFVNIGLSFLKTCGRGTGSKIYSNSNFNTTNPDKYLIFVDGFIQQFQKDYTISEDGCIVFEVELHHNNTYLFLTLNNSNCGSSYFNKTIIKTEEERSWFELQSYTDNNSQNYLVFVNKQIKFPLIDFNIHNGILTFRQNILPNSSVLIYNLPPNNNNSYFEFSNFLSDENITEYSLPVAVSKKDEDYLIFIDGRVMIPGFDFQITNQYVKFSKKIPSNLNICIFALINTPSPALVGIDKISTLGASHGDVIVYDKNLNKWKSSNIFNVPELKLTEFTLPLEHLSVNGANHGDCIVFNKPLNKWTTEKISTNNNSAETITVNDFNCISSLQFDTSKFNLIKNGSSVEIYTKKTKISDLDRSNIPPGSYVNFDGKNWIASPAVLKCSTKEDKLVYDVKWLVFDKNFKLTNVDGAVLIETNAINQIHNLHCESATENDIVIFKDGKYRSLPFNYINPKIIPVYKTSDLNDQHINNIIISNVSYPITINIPSYQDLNVDVGSKVTLIQANEGSLKITSNEDVEVISSLDSPITNKKGCKLELLKLTHRKWLLS